MPITRPRRFSIGLPSHDNLVDLPGSLADPGNLLGHTYAPPSLRVGAPLVVVLHGCTQDAAGYAQAAGWFDLADRHGFALLVPRQQRSNNANLCFNWFEPGDTRRGGGEAASIAAMVEWTVAHHRIDPERVFVTGLSAGAAMACTMLATYPEIFAGGGLIAGLPHGTAQSVQAALQQMRGGTRDTGEQLARRISSASNHKSRWPRVSIWHGSADHVVAPANGEATTRQWLAVHGLEAMAPVHDGSATFKRRSWSDADGVVQVEHVEVSGMGHGTPIDTRGKDAVGSPIAHVIDAGVASSVHLIDFWGLTDEVAPASSVVAVDTAYPAPRAVRKLEPVTAARPGPVSRHETGVEKIINDALRAAGLLK